MVNEPKSEQILEFLQSVCLKRQSYAQSIFLVWIELPDDAKCIKCNDWLCCDKIL